jgi:hypothetical protein
MASQGPEAQPANQSKWLVRPKVERMMDVGTICTIYLASHHSNELADGPVGGSEKAYRGYTALKTASPQGAIAKSSRVCPKE